MLESFKNIKSVKGELSFSGDKSISHRALIISSLAEGKSSIRNLSYSDDVKSTIDCLQALGIELNYLDEEFIIEGRGFKGYKRPLKQLNVGNSGTTARLLSGLLAVQIFESSITGESSLISRPMKRVIEPLSLIGGIVESNEGKLPLHFYRSKKLQPVRYEMPVASAQVKSAILLAGLHLDEETSVIEKKTTRDHTETLLDLTVVESKEKKIINVSKKNYPQPRDYFIPGDISSAMFFVVLALLSKNSELIITGISLNPTRTEGLRLLKRMGGSIKIEVNGESNGELIGNLLVRSSELSNVKIDPEIVPQIIDEIPILSVAGAFAEGSFEIKGVDELRVKESDRIKTLISNFILLGLNVEEFPDGFRISGKIKKAAKPFNSFGDHRIAMAFAILSSLLKDGEKVDGFESVSKSNPDFLSQLKSVSF